MKEATPPGDQVRSVAEENALLRRNNGALAGELEQMNRVASYVGSRVARVLAGARRANNANAALVGELKRWNRKLEGENQRLFTARRLAGRAQAGVDQG